MNSLRKSVTIALLLLSVTAGCRREPPPPPETYRVRAQVRQVPAPDAARGEILVRHEAISEFKNEDGKIVGMESMSMSFPLADVALAAGVAAGDRIELEFDVSWHGGNPLEVTAIDKLPEDTRLAFEPPAETPESSPPPEATENPSAEEDPPQP